MDTQVSSNPFGGQLQEPLQPLNAHRALAAALGEVLGSASIFGGAAVETIGGFVVLARFITKRVADGGLVLGLSQRDARLALATAGTGGVEAQDLLERLEFVGLISATEGGYAVPALSVALVAELNHFRNRVSGWARRGKDRTESNPPSHPVGQEVVATPPASPAPVAGAQIPLVDDAPDFTQAKSAKAIKKSADAPYVLRADKDDTSPALPYAIPCSGKVAYVSERYLEEIQKLHPRIDTLHELKLAIQWCKDNVERQKTQRGAARFLNHWFTNTSSTKSMQAQVIGAATQRNGFGAGASTSAPADVTPGPVGDNLDTGLDDLTREDDPTYVANDDVGPHEQEQYLQVQSEGIERSSLEFDLDNLGAPEGTTGAEQTGAPAGAPVASTLSCEIVELDGRPVPPVDEEPEGVHVSAEVAGDLPPVTEAVPQVVSAPKVVITKPARGRVFQREQYVSGSRSA